DANETKVSQLFGKNWTSGHAVVGYEFYRRNALAFTSKDFSANSDQRPRGGDDFRSLNSNPANILDPNTFEPAFAIPRGQDGTHLAPSQLIAGPFNLQNVNEGEKLLPQQKHNSGFLSVAQDFGSRLNLALEGHYTVRPTSTDPSPLNGLLLVPSSNAFF